MYIQRKTRIFVVTNGSLKKQINLNITIFFLMYLDKLENNAISLHITRFLVFKTLIIIYGFF